MRSIAQHGNDNLSNLGYFYFSKRRVTRHEVTDQIFHDMNISRMKQREKQSPALLGNTQHAKDYAVGLTLDKLMLKPARSWLGHAGVLYSVLHVLKFSNWEEE